MNLICAVSKNGVIGNSETNSMPWHIPQDLKHFKELTLDRTVIMGSNTFNSIGKKLPRRKSVVISSGATPLITSPDSVYSSLEEAVEKEDSNGFIIGGASLFKQGVLMQSNLFMTIVDLHSDGDVKFPITGSELLSDSVFYEDRVFKCVDRSDWMSDGNYSFQFATFIPYI